MLVSEDANHHRNSESGPRDQDFSQPKDESDRCSETTSTLCQTTLTCSNEDTVKAVGIESQDKIGNQSSGLVNTVTRLDISTESKLKDYPVFSNRKEAYIVDAKSDGKAKLTGTEEEIEMRHLTADSLLSEEQTDDQLREKFANTEMTSAIEKDEARILVSPSVFEEEKNLLSDTTTNKVESSINYPSWQKMCTFRNQRGSFKKSRRRNSNLKRSFSETDKNPRQDTKVDMSRPSSDTIGASDTMSEDEGCCSRNDDRTSIIEVPDVAVVSGGSIMPKNLCSTRTPISRIQRAPSRATYTTAYI